MQQHWRHHRLMTQYGLLPSVPGPGANSPEARPWLGFGLGLRTEHFSAMLEQSPHVDWLEINSENFMVAGGKPRQFLEAFRQRYPIVMHGVSLSIGSAEPLDMHYLAALKRLAEIVQPAWVSDHLCWTGVDGVNSHDLLPLPYCTAAVEHVVGRVQRVQDYLGREILLENLSSYVQFSASQMTEWEFLAAISQRSGCRLLLDVNNIVVSARNQGFVALEFLRGLPADRIWQIHLAGHTDYGSYAIDTHDHAVPDAVWTLYEQAIELLGPVSTMIERDDHIPPLDELVAELDLARAAHARVISRQRSRAA
ncbi:MAG: MNIO family bufferin maturase [Arenimonas sp.]